jgi:O-methyltransferase involved in polyketide biosynthesis
MDETPDWMRAAARAPVDLQTDRPHPARVYDHLLGGKTHYAADREQSEKTLAAFPHAAVTARENRAFMHRAVRTLAEEHGIRQFLDVGTGIPTSPNLHEVVQSVDPSSRVVYADNDPIVLTHSRALHASAPEGATTYIQADATDPESILTSPGLLETLDLGRPVTITLLALMHWLPGDSDYALVRALTDAVPAGSALAITYVTRDFDEDTANLEDSFKGSGANLRARTRAEVERFFDGFDLLEPGLCSAQDWRPVPVEVGEGSRDTARYVIPLWSGVGIKRGS